MLILGLLGMYFDAAVVFVTNSSLFFRLAVAILCLHFCSACRKNAASYSGIISQSDYIEKMFFVTLI